MFNSFEVLGYGTIHLTGTVIEVAVGDIVSIVLYAGSASFRPMEDVYDTVDIKLGEDDVPKRLSFDTLFKYKIETAQFPSADDRLIIKLREIDYGEFFQELSAKGSSGVEVLRELDLGSFDRLIREAMSEPTEQFISR